MSESNYYREPSGPGPGEPYQTDKILGIIIMVLSVCCTVAGGAAMAGMSMLAGMGAAGAASEGGAGSGEAAATAAAVGGVAAFIGIILLVTGLLGVATGYGIMKSLKWGFILGAVVYGLNTVANIASFNIIGLVISGALLAYCVMRLTGKLGPPLAG